MVVGFRENRTAASSAMQDKSRWRDKISFFFPPSSGLSSRKKYFPWDQEGLL